MRAKTICVIILTFLITVILMQNTDEVKFKALFWDLYLPKLVILTGVIVAGIILGLLIGSRPYKPPVNNYVNENPNSTNTPFDTLSQEDRDYISD
jgi:multisubunit Na+/H+ antiporter MnhB subunit